MTLKKHQIDAVNTAKDILKTRGLVYIFGQPRVGKSLIALELAKQVRPRQEGKTIVFTRKMAINDWLQYKEDYSYEVTNYEKAKHYDPSEYNFIIIDEAHNFGAFPKPSLRVKLLREFCKNKPIVFLSGTPFVESQNSVYTQLSLSSFSPFNKFYNGYSFFKAYGIPDTIYLYGKQVESYKKANWPKIEKEIEPYIVKVTYEDAGIEYSNLDKVHEIQSPDVDELLEGIYKTWTACENYSIEEWETYDGRSGTYFSAVGGYPLENSSAQCQAMLQYVGGFYKDLQIPQPKLEWLKKFILENPGKTAIMCYFTQEQEELTKIFKNNPNVAVYSSTKYCEGIDLSGFDNYILYSFGYSGAKFIQLRDRVVNIHQNRPTTVHIPIIMGTLDEDHYKRVKNKQHFNLTMVFSRYKNKQEMG